MAKEKNLTAVTSVAAADFARVVTSAGASVKATFANVAKYIVETYNGSTVAGSAQSVKSALDSLNSKTFTLDPVNKATGLNGNENLNSFTTPALYRSGGSSVSANIQNTPVTNAGYALYVIPVSTSFVMQIALIANTPASICFRTYRSNNNTWSSWVTIS